MPKAPVSRGTALYYFTGIEIRKKIRTLAWPADRMLEVLFFRRLIYGSVVTGLALQFSNFRPSIFSQVLCSLRTFSIISPYPDEPGRIGKHWRFRLNSKKH